MKKTTFFKRFVWLLMVCMMLGGITIPAMAAVYTATSGFYLDVYNYARGIISGNVTIPAGTGYVVYAAATVPGDLCFYYSNGDGNVFAHVEVTTSGVEEVKTFYYDVGQWIFYPDNKYVNYSYSFIVE